MKIKVTKNSRKDDLCWQADIIDLPGSPRLGFGKNAANISFV